MIGAVLTGNPRCAMPGGRDSLRPPFVVTGRSDFDAHSVEGCFPFLDRPVAALAETLSPTY